MPTYMCFLDLTFAFDIASIPHMLLNCAKAGICAQAWLLMDDILASDSQTILLSGLLTSFLTVFLTAADILWEAHRRKPANNIDTFRLPKPALADAVTSVAAIARTEKPMGPRTRDALALTLPEMPDTADRFDLFGSLGDCGLHCVQYSDDCTVPYHSLGAVTRVLGHDEASACNCFALKTQNKVLF